MSLRRLLFTSLFFSLLFGSGAYAKTKITIVNGDKPGFGFNDPTPVTPIGGNPGTTLGEQRLKAFEAAGDIWANLIDSDIEIRIKASFGDLDCDATSAVLGQARTASFVSDFANAPQSGVFYPIALASKFAKSDLASGGPHIVATFNTFALKGCSFKWYYGLDNNHGPNEDLVVVLLHEFGHGLGFAGNVDGSTGRYRTGSLPSAFDVHVTDDSTGLRFDQMSNDQRALAATNSQHLVWDGAEVTRAVPSSLGPTPSLEVSAPPSVAKGYGINVAAFSGPFSLTGINGTLAAPLDAAEPAVDTTVAGTTTDGCSEYQNASAIAGRIAIIDRGRCTFVEKAVRAQAAGATAVIIVDNRVAASAPGMGGTNTTIRIPVLSMTQADGNALRAQLSTGVSARVFSDALNLSGANKGGLPKLYAPSTIEGGSSLYHWDTSATPNLLMEPAINGDLKHTVDLTLYQLLDIGWTLASGSGATPAPQLPVPGRRILKRGR